jgi:hypothetical protein
MLPTWLRRTIYSLTITAWLVLAAAATPAGSAVTPPQCLLAVLIAGVGTIKFLVRRMLAPANELFYAGKAAGRLEVEKERAGGNVFRLEERRAIRAVSRS